MIGHLAYIVFWAGSSRHGCAVANLSVQTLLWRICSLASWWRRSSDTPWLTQYLCSRRFGAIWILHKSDLIIHIVNCCGTYVCMYVYIYVCMYVCVYMYVCMYMCMYAYVCVCVRMYVCMYVCTYFFLIIVNKHVPLQNSNTNANSFLLQSLVTHANSFLLQSLVTPINTVYIPYLSGPSYVFNTFPPAGV